MDSEIHLLENLLRTNRIPGLPNEAPLQAEHSRNVAYVNEAPNEEIFDLRTVEVVVMNYGGREDPNESEGSLAGSEALNMSEWPIL